MFFSLASNILVVSSILIGGAAAINSLTGMNVYASLWLLPLSVSAYTIRGGLRATILTDYVRSIHRRDNRSADSCRSIPRSS